MPRKAARSEVPADSSYEKVSATLDREVLRMIRERTPNVSAFLNEAAKDRLYFQRLDEMIAELDRQGVKPDEKMAEWLRRKGEEFERIRPTLRAKK